MALTALKLFGVTLLDRESRAPISAEASLVAYRDLGALVKSAPFAPVAAGTAELSLYHRIVEDAFHRSAVLPAPIGVVFRSAEHVRQWLEQNYIALSEGIHFVVGRCETRVHITDAEDSPTGTPADSVTSATESFRLLRRAAVAAVPVRHEQERAVLSGAFLIDQDRWDEFAEQVQEQARRSDALHFEQTGPWPPYDFVRLEFGA
jgi:Gas vesicle synthesis protein GvpL/GvpF